VGRRRRAPSSPSAVVTVRVSVVVTSEPAADPSTRTSRSSDVRQQATTSRVREGTRACAGGIAGVRGRRRAHPEPRGGSHATYSYLWSHVFRRLWLPALCHLLRTACLFGRGFHGGGVGWSAVAVRVALCSGVLPRVYVSVLHRVYVLYHRVLLLYHSVSVCYYLTHDGDGSGSG